MNTALIQQALHGSEAGQLTFPQVVGMLHEAGVESYAVDLLHGDDTFYLLDGKTHVESIKPESTPVAADFSADEVIAAIRGAQADTVRYPEFVRRIRAAGTVGYRVYLTGRCALYFGRKGEIHREEFPKPAN
jgi:uncharacterized protein YbcV (DUF1398 family)